MKTEDNIKNYTTRFSSTKVVEAGSIIYETIWWTTNQNIWLVLETGSGKTGISVFPLVTCNSEVGIYCTKVTWYAKNTWKINESIWNKLCWEDFHLLE